MGVNGRELRDIKLEGSNTCRPRGGRESARNAEPPKELAGRTNIAFEDVRALRAVRHAAHAIRRCLSWLVNANGCEVFFLGDSIHCEAHLNSGFEGSKSHLVIVVNCKGRDIAYWFLRRVRVEHLSGSIGHLLSGRGCSQLRVDVGINSREIARIE